MGYIQRSPKRIRKAYERIFEDNHGIGNVQNGEPEAQPQLSNEYYKKMAAQKYITGEIDVDTLHPILTTLESKENKRKRPYEPSYR